MALLITKLNLNDRMKHKKKRDLESVLKITLVREIPSEKVQKNIYLYVTRS